MQNSAPLSGSGLTNVGHNSSVYELKVIQEPEDGRALAKQEKTRGARWPLDPPPVIEFNVHDNDKHRAYLHSPFWFCTAELDTISQTGQAAPGNALTGTTVSSLHKVKLTDNKERGFFIFGDLNVKNQGMHRIRFSLFEMRQSSSGMFAEKLTSVYSKQFKVHSAKAHVPQRESTQLSRTLCEAGVKLRIRKESTKRKSQCVDWSADRPHHIPYHGQILPPPSSVMPPPSRPLNAQYAHGLSTTVGESVSHRLSVQGSSLGIREHLEKVAHDPLNRSMGPYKRSDSWGEPQQNWQMAGWQQEPLQGFYATPASTPGSEVRSSYSPYTNGHYQSAPAMPPSPYSFSSNNHVQWDPNHLRTPNQGVLFDQSFEQPQRHLEVSTQGLNQDDQSQIPTYGLGSYSGPASIVYGPGVTSTYPSYTTNSKSYPMASTAGGDVGNQFS